MDWSSDPFLWVMMGIIIFSIVFAVVFFMKNAKDKGHFVERRKNGPRSQS